MIIVPTPSVGGYQGETQRILGNVPAQIWDEVDTGHSIANTFGNTLRAIEDLLPASVIAAASDIAGSPALDIIHSTLVDNLASSGVSDVINVTEEGVLIAIAVYLRTAASVAVVSQLEITIDGGTTRTIPVYNASSAIWLDTGLGAFALVDIAQPGATNERAVIPLGTRYAVSCQVSHNVTTLGTGSLILHAIRGTVIP